MAARLMVLAVAVGLQYVSANSSSSSSSGKTCDSDVPCKLPPPGVRWTAGRTNPWTNTAFTLTATDSNPITVKLLRFTKLSPNDELWFCSVPTPKSPCNSTSPRNVVTVQSPVPGTEYTLAVVDKVRSLTDTVTFALLWCYTEGCPMVCPAAESGVECSGHGACLHKVCQCDSGHWGEACQNLGDDPHQGHSSGVKWWVVLLIVAGCAVIVLGAAGAFVAFRLRRKRAAYAGLDDRAWEDRNPLECACRRGSVSLVRLLSSPGFGWDPALYPRVLECAAEFGSVDCVSLLVELGAFWTRDTADRAVVSGSVEMARLVRKNGCQFAWSCCVEAAERGHLEMLRYLHEECGRSLDVVCHYAASVGNLECLRYIKENCDDWDPDILERVAGESGRLEVLQYLKDNGVEWTEETCASVARGGHLELLKRFHEEFGVPWDEQTPSRAAEGGHLYCLLYSRQNGCPWDADSMCLTSVRGGSMECLRYCIAQGCALSDPRICLEAASKSAELLRVVRERGCPWHPLCFDTAIVAGRLDVAQYLHENGCTWDVKTSPPVVRRLRVLEYLHESGFPWNESTCIAAATSLSSSSCLAYAMRSGCQCGQRVIESAAIVGSVVCLKYGHEHGLSLTSEVLALAVQNDRVGVLKYCRSVGCSWDSGTMQSALDRGSLLCFRYCLENGCPCDYGTFSNRPNFLRWVNEGLSPPATAR